MAERPRDACFVFLSSFFRKITNLHFGATVWGHHGQSLYVKVLTQRNFVVESYRENVSFIRKIAK